MENTYMRSSNDELNVCLNEVRVLIFYGTNDLLSGNAAVSDILNDADWSEMEVF